MNQTKFTPGPWRIKGDFVLRDEPEVETTIGMAVSCVCELHGNKKANARLISKAPEMFEALKALLEADHAICENIGAKSDQAMQRIAAIDQAQALLNAIHNGGAK